MTHFKSLLLVLICSISYLQAQLDLENPSLNDKFIPGDQKISNLNFNLFERIELADQFELGHPLLFGNYNGFFNFDQHQTELSISAGFSDGGSNASRINAGLSFFGGASITHRRYLTDKFFFSIQLDIRQESNNRNTNTNYALGSGIGIGRINVYNELAIADKLIGELQDKNQLNRELSQAERFELANYIRSIKNQRFITNRGDIKNEYRLLKEKLVNWNVLKESINFQDLEQTITNSYQFEPMINRTNGSRISFNSQIENSHYSFDNRIFGLSIVADNQKIYTASLGFEKDRYVNHKTQLNYGVSTTLLHTSIRDFLEPNLLKNWTNLTTSANAELHYLPNLKTHWSARLSAFHTRHIEKPISTINTNEYGANLNLGYERQFRRNLRVSFGLDLGYSRLEKLSVMPSIGIRF